MVIFCPEDDSKSIVGDEKQARKVQEDCRDSCLVHQLPEGKDYAAQDADKGIHHAKYLQHAASQFASCTFVQFNIGLE